MHLWHISQLKNAVGLSRLFLAYDGLGGPQAVDTLSAHSGLHRSHIHACSWSNQTASLHPKLLKRKGIDAHRLVEPVVSCWCEVFCKIFTHVWIIEKDAAFQGNLAMFLSQFDKDNADLLAQKYSYAAFGSWLYDLRDNASRQNGPCSDIKRWQALQKMPQNATADIARDPTGLVFHRIQVRRLSTRLLEEVLDTLRSGHYLVSEVLASTVCSHRESCLLNTWVTNSSQPTAHCFDYRIKHLTPMTNASNPWRIKLQINQKPSQAWRGYFASWCAPREAIGDCREQWLHPVIELKNHHRLVDSGLRCMTGGSQSQVVL